MGFEYLLLWLAGLVTLWLCWLNYQETTTTKNSSATYKFLISLIVSVSFVFFTIWTTSNMVTKSDSDLPTVEETYATTLKEYTDKEELLENAIPRDEYAYQQVKKDKEEFIKGAEVELLSSDEYKDAVVQQLKVGKQQTAVALLLGVYDISTVIIQALQYSTFNRIRRLAILNENK